LAANVKKIFSEDLNPNPDVHRGHESPVDPLRAESADKSDALQTPCDVEGVIGERAGVWSASVFSAAFSGRPGLPVYGKTAAAVLDRRKLRRSTGVAAT
jgi:hypothetical protein